MIAWDGKISCMRITLDTYKPGRWEGNTTCSVNKYTTNPKTGCLSRGLGRRDTYKPLPISHLLITETGTGVSHG
jgi:hypothetical protein